MVAMKDKQVYLVDNTALSRRAGDLSTLTTGLEHTRAEARRALVEMAQSDKRTSEEVTRLRAAVDAIDAGRVVRVVSDANVQREDRVRRDIADRLAAQGIRYLRIADDEEKR